ncbi:hypothetical protein WS48_32360 [Burkholderia sp. RF7-non_BP1]|nr:hypothetical protein WS45_31415 [Burkholderia sp. RF2-non_BP3]KUY78863.1 hypothetical protein WS46_20845 [Burkholderia sp. RF4-BP95]KUY87176.1 hypothetical protein WS48_32360 [Burkholderia sp. RF7-non_BP1]KUZ03274.1 hypothetical protein WS49_11165 [Burkholderia sp. RF7-non_BP4]
MPAAQAGAAGAEPKFQMNRNPQERRTPEQIRAGNKRLGLTLLVIAAVFFVGVVIKQWWLSTH